MRSDWQGGMIDRGIRVFGTLHTTGVPIPSKVSSTQFGLSMAKFLVAGCVAVTGSKVAEE